MVRRSRWQKIGLFCSLLCGRFVLQKSREKTNKQATKKGHIRSQAQAVNIINLLCVISVYLVFVLTFKVRNLLKFSVHVHVLP